MQQAYKYGLQHAPMKYPQGRAVSYSQLAACRPDAYTAASLAAVQKFVHACGVETGYWSGLLLYDIVVLSASYKPQQKPRPLCRRHREVFIG